MAVVISEERVKQVTDVVNRWIDSFVPFDDNNTPEKFLSCFDQGVEWYDHGFCVLRVGHDAVLGLQKSFLHCNQPFKASIKALYPIKEGAVVEQLWVGKCANDIVRPDGTVVIKASGKDFQTHVGFVVRISDEGLITRIDEYDHRYWDEGKPESQYTKVGAVGHKA